MVGVEPDGEPGIVDALEPADDGVEMLCGVVTDADNDAADEATAIPSASLHRTLLDSVELDLRKIPPLETLPETDAVSSTELLTVGVSVEWVGGLLAAAVTTSPSSKSPESDGGAP